MESISVQAKDGSFSLSLYLSTGANLVSFPDNDNRWVRLQTSSVYEKWELLVIRVANS